MILKKIRYKNFLSSGNVWITFDLNCYKNVLFIGENGSGKSTLIDAIMFALFGRPYRKINKPQLVSTLTKKNMLVELEFSAHGNTYVIRRGLAPVVFEVFLDGSLLSQDSDSKDYQKHLETIILRTNYKTFRQVVILGSSSFIPFMQLSALERREVSEDLLDLQVFTVMNTLLKGQADQNQKTIVSLEQEKQQVEKVIELSKKHMEEMKEINEGIIADKKKSIQDYQQQILDTQKQVEEKQGQVKVLLEGMSDVNAVQKRAKQFDKLNTQLEQKIGDFQKQVKFFDEQNNCPTCEQVLQEGHKTEMISTILNKQQEVEAGVTKLQDEFIKIKERLEQIDVDGQRVSGLQTEISMLQGQYFVCKESIRDLEDQISQIEYTVDIKDESSSKINELKGQLEEINLCLERDMNDQRIMNYANIFLKDTGIKSKIIKQYIPIINKLMNKYLAALDFFCEFRLDETFSETIKSRGRDTFSYEFFSEGEKLRIDLAVLFTWRSIAKMRNSMDCNLLIFDEILDRSLDMNGVDELVKILLTLPNNENIIVISHKEAFQDKFEKVFRFEKNKNFSQMKELM